MRLVRRCSKLVEAKPLDVYLTEPEALKLRRQAKARGQSLGALVADMSRAWGEVRPKLAVKGKP